MKTTLILSLLLWFSSANAQLKKADLILSDITVVDVANNKLIRHQTVVIGKDRIIEVGANAIGKKYQAQQLILSTGKYIMPSLWDMHVHFGVNTLKEENKWLLPLYLTAGVTAVRDCAGDISLELLAWKKAIAAGKLEGPTIFTSGPKLEGPKSIWPGDLEIANETENELGFGFLEKITS